MKVALLVPGGVDRSGTRRVIPFVLWLIERVARRHELHVFALQQERRTTRYPLRGATVHAVGPRPRRLRAATAILREHRRARFDLFHGLWATPQGVLTGVLGRLLGRPSVLHLVGGDVRSIPKIGYGLLRTARGRMWLRLAVASVDRVLVSSHEMVRFAGEIGVPVESVRFGVDLERWPPREPVPRVPSDPPRLIHVASLNPVKDQRTLLEAFRRVAQVRPDAVLEVVGEDTLDGEIQALAGDLGLDGRVTFHGFLPHDRLRPIVEASDLMVLSSYHESGPLVVQEAAVAGVPTVGTAVGHLVEWAPEAAVTVPVGEPEALASAILDVLSDDKRRLELAREAQARSVEKDADWTAARVLEIYDELTETG